MSDIQRIVKALERAINDATFIETTYHGMMRGVTKEECIDGSMLAAAVQAVVNIYKDEPNEQLIK